MNFELVQAVPVMIVAVAVPRLPVLFHTPLVPDEKIDLSPGEVDVGSRFKIVMRIVKPEEPAEKTMQYF